MRLLGSLMLGWATLRPLLAFVVGFVDTAAFVHMGGLFVAHVTGNVVLLGATLAGAQEFGARPGAVTLQLLTFPVFFGAVALAAVIASAASARGRDFGRILLWFAAITMVMAAALPLLGRGYDPVSSLALVASMGVLNCVHRIDGRVGPPFTVMTGNATALAVALVRRMGLAARLETVRGSGVVLLLLLGFLIGAAAGAVGALRFGLLANALPALLLAAHLLFLKQDVPAK